MHTALFSFFFFFLNQGWPFISYSLGHHTNFSSHISREVQSIWRLVKYTSTWLNANFPFKWISVLFSLSKHLHQSSKRTLPCLLQSHPHITWRLKWYRNKHQFFLNATFSLLWVLPEHSSVPRGTPSVACPAARIHQVQTLWHHHAVAPTGFPSYATGTTLWRWKSHSLLITAITLVWQNFCNWL